MLRVDIADDHRVVLKGLKEILSESFDDVAIDGTATGYELSARFMSRAFSSSVFPGTGGQIELLNAHGEDITIESKQLFDFKGLSLCTFWTDKARVCVEGWEKEVRKYATTQAVSLASTIRCALDYLGIDRVELEAGWHTPGDQYHHGSNQMRPWPRCLMGLPN